MVWGIISSNNLLLRLAHQLKAEDLITRLQTEVSRLRKLKGEEVAFFFVMAPGSENPSTQLFTGQSRG